ncbi:MAG: LamG-like jellyroll fold domain-containing protein [Akkermansiaceae bacterium]
MKKRDDWQLLIQRHLDGLTTAEEADELSAAIIEDDEIRADYLKAAKVHAELTDEWLMVEENQLADSGIPNLCGSPKRKISPLVVCGLGIAALLMIWLSLSILWRPVEPATDEWGQAIAKVEELSDDAVLAHDQSFSEGGFLDKGWVNLKEGMMRLKFRSGAVATLEGPCSFGIDSPLRSYLDFGKVSVYAPESARDFVVATAAMEVVDLGTRFDFEVDSETGESVVNVSEGLVDLHLGSRGTRREIQPLEAGWKAVVDGSGEIIEMKGDREESEVDLSKPVAHWEFDTIREDGLVRDSGSGRFDGYLIQKNDGDLVTGVSGQAVSFSKPQAVDLSSHVSSIAELDAFTFSAWVRDPEPSVGILFSVSDGSANNRIQINLNKKYFVYLWQNRSVRWDSIAGRVTQWVPGRWYHLAVTVGSNGVKLYRDGELLASTHLGVQIGTPFLRFSDLKNPREMFLGHIRQGTADVRLKPQWFHGVMDDVRIYDHVLDQNSIKELSEARGR